jgi:hypothetical protein
MHLSEDGELARTVAGPPLPNAAFKGAFMGIEELTGMLLSEPAEECLGREPRFGSELGLNLVPNFGEGVVACAVSAWNVATDAGERGVVAVMSCRLVGHPCPPGRDGQRGSLFEQLPQLADLPIGDDHRRPPGVGGCVQPRLSDGNSNCRWKGVLIAALHHPHFGKLFLLRQAGSGLIGSWA